MIKQLRGGCFSRIFCILLLSLCICDYSYSNGKPLFTEICYLDDNYVLLYKIINWWNDSEPGDDHLICGTTLKCKIKGNLNIHYDNDQELLTIRVNSNIEELVSIFKECESCRGPSYFRCSYLNEKYFGKVDAVDTLVIHSTINTIEIQGVPRNQYLQIHNIEEFITVEIKGKVDGLLLENGKIALHQNGDFFKSCPQSSKGLPQQSETVLTIKNDNTKEVLAQYTIIAGGN